MLTAARCLLALQLDACLHCILISSTGVSHSSLDGDVGLIRFPRLFLFLLSMHLTRADLSADVFGAAAFIECCNRLVFLTRQFCDWGAVNVSMHFVHAPLVFNHSSGSCVLIRMKS